jgi:hypothetical protein
MDDDTLITLLGFRNNDDDADNMVPLLMLNSIMSQVIMRVLEAAPTDADDTYPIPYISELAWGQLDFVALKQQVAATPAKQSGSSALEQERQLNKRILEEAARERAADQVEMQKKIDAIQSAKAKLPTPDPVALTRAEAATNAVKLKEDIMAAVTAALASDRTRGDNDEPPTKKPRTEPNTINSGEFMDKLINAPAVRPSQYEQQYVIPELLPKLAKGEYGCVYVDKLFAWRIHHEAVSHIKVVTDSDGVQSFQTQESAKPKVVNVHQIIDCIRYLAATYKEVNAVGAQHLLITLPFAINECAIQANNDILYIKAYVDNVLRVYFDGIQRGTNVSLHFDSDTLAHAKRSVDTARKDDQRSKQLAANYKQSLKPQRLFGNDKSPNNKPKLGESPITYVDGPPSPTEHCRNYAKGVPCKVINRGTGRCHLLHLQGPTPPAKANQQQQPYGTPAPYGNKQ